MRAESSLFSWCFSSPWASSPFPSDAQEAAYTQLVQRREASLKHVLRLPIDQAIDALVRAGFHYNESFFSDQEFREAYFQAMLNDLSKGYSQPIFPLIKTLEDTLIYINTTLCALHLQLLFSPHRPGDGKPIPVEGERPGDCRAFFLPGAVRHVRPGVRPSPGGLRP